VVVTTSLLVGSTLSSAVSTPPARNRSCWILPVPTWENEWRVCPGDSDVIDGGPFSVGDVFLGPPDQADIDDPMLRTASFGSCTELAALQERIGSALTQQAINRSAALTVRCAEAELVRMATVPTSSFLDDNGDGERSWDLVRGGDGNLCLEGQCNVPVPRDVGVAPSEGVNPERQYPIADGDSVIYVPANAGRSDSAPVDPPSGEHLSISELGRGDFDHDGIEDVAFESKVNFGGSCWKFGLTWMTRRSPEAPFEVHQVGDEGFGDACS
jgi:hypothetical protein